MLIINRQKKHGVAFREIWNAEGSCSLPGINLYRGAKSPIGRELSRVRTLVTDLSLPVEDIIALFKKNTRYEIRRAERDEVRFEMKMGAEITSEDIHNFCSFFDGFWKRKGMESEGYDKYRREIQTYVSEGVFAISRVYDREGGFLATHTYIVGDDFVRLYQSASIIGETDDRERNAFAGRANRYLHLKDMEFFKERGKKIYDWGGAGQNESVASITDFKEGFGGKELFYYNSEEVKGLWPGLIKGVINIISRM